MQNRLQFSSLAEAERVLDYYENQPRPFRCTNVPMTGPQPGIARLAVQDCIVDAGESSARGVLADEGPLAPTWQLAALFRSGGEFDERGAPG